MSVDTSKQVSSMTEYVDKMKSQEPEGETRRVGKTENRGEGLVDGGRDGR